MWTSAQILSTLSDERQFLYSLISLLAHLRCRNQKRLLHPGADTKDILLQYVSTIKCLRIVDPPGVLLFKVADPIRRYLRQVILCLYSVLLIIDLLSATAQTLFDVLLLAWLVMVKAATH